MFYGIHDLILLGLPGLAEPGSHTPWAFYAVLALGFVAAISIGSVAWYNSKRPAGWEDKDRPTIVPKVDQEP
jgi:hypothetical protein